MHKFVRCLITEWRRLKLPVQDLTAVVGVSGGADSLSLLLAMHELRQREKLRIRLVAAHFNHHLRNSESDADEHFIKEITRERAIELAIGHANGLHGGNVEQNARNARYEFLHQTAKNLHAFAVLTGHTINDQAETFLMNLVRGSGPAGLRGMPLVRPFAGGNAADRHQPLLLIRPLLNWAKRSDTEAYCHALGAEYRYDTMNEDTAFRRVRIRKILLPLLEDMNPKIVETLANTASLMQDLPQPIPERNSTAEGSELYLADLRQLSRQALYELLRSWLAKHRGTMRQLQLKHIQNIERLVLSKKSGRTVEVPGGRVVKSGGRLTYEQNKVDK